MQGLVKLVSLVSIFCTTLIAMAHDHPMVYPYISDNKNKFIYPSTVDAGLPFGGGRLVLRGQPKKTMYYNMHTASALSMIIIAFRGYQAGQ